MLTVSIRCPAVNEDRWSTLDKCFWKVNTSTVVVTFPSGREAADLRQALQEERDCAVSLGLPLLVCDLAGKEF